MEAVSCHLPFHPKTVLLRMYLATYPLSPTDMFVESLPGRPSRYDHRRCVDVCRCADGAPPTLGAASWRPCNLMCAMGEKTTKYYCHG